MTEYDRRSTWIIALGALLLAAAAAVVAYNIGVSHGLAQSAAAQGAAPAYAWGPGYGWGYRPFGLGFPFFFVFLFFWVFLFRGLWWGGPWRRRWYYGGPPEAPGSFDEWHRRAHEGMTPTSGTASTGKESHPADDPRGRR